MTFYNISNPESFFEAVLSCEGNVYCAKGGQPESNLKESAGYFIKSGMARLIGEIPQIEVVAEHSKDAKKLIRFMAEMNRMPARRSA